MSGVVSKAYESLGIALIYWNENRKPNIFLTLSCFHYLLYCVSSHVAKLFVLILHRQHDLSVHGLACCHDAFGDSVVSVYACCFKVLQTTPTASL